MIDDATLSLITPDNAAQIAMTLCADDMPALIERLNSAEDKIRYPAFLLLRAHSYGSADLLPFWDELADKLTSENSYQRSLGAMLLAANARHDSAGRMRSTLPRFLALLNDPKPITVRQCAQALPEILAAQPELASEIASAILAVDLLGFKDTMRKLILVDFLDALVLFRETAPSAALEEYFFSALSGNILDEKAKKQLRAKLNLPK
ncbi:MAG TPA: hypothetical protein VN453_01265 [Feifaniaceae bacterium]|nr:hypothetical protein [Feifaniaceae bacterium]